VTCRCILGYTRVPVSALSFHFFVAVVEYLTANAHLRVSYNLTVTAGVLRGKKLRFQLFADTVNTVARTETIGSRGRIHLSQDCADLIVAAGKSRWIRPRENKVTAKGT